MVKRFLFFLVEVVSSAIFGAVVDKVIPPRSSPSKHTVEGYTRKQTYGLRSNPQQKVVHIKQHTRGSGTKV